MKKLSLLAGAALLAWTSIGPAQAQRAYYGGWHHRGGWGNGGAVAAGLVGGALIGGLIASAATPAYGYPGYGYGYGSPYRGYAAPVATVDDQYYQPAPVYRTRVVYRQPRIVYRQPRVVNRVFYEQPRVRTRVVYRQDQPRRLVRTNIRRDVVTTGSIRDRRAIRVQYR